MAAHTMILSLIDEWRILKHDQQWVIDDHTKG